MANAFDEWCASVKDCGHDVQPNSATARQRKLGWDAAMATRPAGVEALLELLEADKLANTTRHSGKRQWYNSVMAIIRQYCGIAAPTEEEALLPCPFCGSKPKLRSVTGRCPPFDVICTGKIGDALCQCHLWPVHTAEEAIAIWNTRAPVREGVDAGRVGEAEKYRAIAHYLFGVLDDIDTAGDLAKENLGWYRKHVESLHKRRFVVAESDGYRVIFKDILDIPTPPARVPSPHRTPSDEQGLLAAVAEAIGKTLIYVEYIPQVDLEKAAKATIAAYRGTPQKEPK